MTRPTIADVPRLLRDECTNCGHERDHHDISGRCAGTDRWYDGRAVRSGPCGCLAFEVTQP